ncbi:MAG: polysaccharide deacetylase family protein [Clostridia bacterium]|nr:polysaccharide deacetylase family protein [Clostridia bacterium]
MKNKEGKSKKLTGLIILIIVVIIIGIVGVVLSKTVFEKDLLLNLGETGNNSDVNLNSSEKVNGEVYKVPENMRAIVPIFMYHFILDDYGSYPDTQNFLRPSTLEEQLKYITENGYQTIFMDEMDELYKYEKPVGLTFDDCFVYFYNNAFPLLKKYNQKATIFIITDYINGENYLTEEQLKEIADSGLVKIESHTKTHQYLDQMTYEEQLEEAVGSKQRLEEITGQEVTVYCYPSGRYNQTTLDIIKDYYDFGLEMLGGVYDSNEVTDMYKITRIYANRDMPLSTFANYLSQSRVTKW